jgi:hypothetical protein
LGPPSLPAQYPRHPFSSGSRVCDQRGSGEPLVRCWDRFRWNRDFGWKCLGNAVDDGSGRARGPQLFDHLGRWLGRCVLDCSARRPVTRTASTATAGTPCSRPAVGDFGRLQNPREAGTEPIRSGCWPSVSLSRGRRGQLLQTGRTTSSVQIIIQGGYFELRF